MKKIFFIIVWMISYLDSYSQVTGSVYEDAVKFFNAISTKEKSEDLMGILSYYFDTTVADLVASKSLLNDPGNPFLQEIFKKYKSKLDKIAPNDAASPTSGGAAGVFGLNVTKYADGIAKFLIERGKQELSMAFFERFKKDLLKYPELAFLFPKSLEIINDIESHNIQTLLQELKDAFMKDLANMPSGILSLKDIKDDACPNNDDKCKTRVNAIKELFNPAASPDPRIFVIPLNVAQGMIDGNNIIEIMNKVVTDPLLCTTNDDFNSFLKLSSILLESLRVGDGSETQGGLFINQAKLKNLFTSEDLLQIFFGLIYQKYNNAENYKCYSSLKIGNNDLKGVFQTILKGRNQFYSLLTSFDKINLSYIAFKRQISLGVKIDPAYMASITIGSATMLDNLVRSTSAVLSITLPESYTSFSKNLVIISDFCTDIQQRNFAGIFNNTIKFIKQNKIFTENEARQKVIKYLSFAANLASATNSDEVKEAINAVALPPGSYSIKQKSSFNVSVNGYVGYNWDFNGGLYANGIYAPVGFSASCGLGKIKGGAVTLFVSVIDVGAVVSYRLKQGTTDDLKQDIRLESIISPSAQLLLAIPKTPIAFGTGWRKTPKLFYSNSMGFTVVKPKDVFSLSILIDIPIFTLRNNPYK